MSRTRRRCYCTLATIVLCAVVGTTATRASDKLPVTLFSFEESKVPKAVRANSAVLRLVESSGSANGHRSLEVTFRSDVANSGVRFAPETAWDWSELGDVGLSLEIVGVGDYPGQIYVEIADSVGGSQVRTACIPNVGKPGKYYLALNGGALNVDSGMRENPSAWNVDGDMLIWLWGAKQIDLSRIAQISVYTDTILHDRTIEIDNLQLFQLPKANPDFLNDISDKFGQNANSDFPQKVRNDEELKKSADSELVLLSSSKPLADRSKFGGWKDGPRLKSTGYFRTAKLDDKWALVDPDGYLYFSTGIANARMANTATMTGIDFKKPAVRDFDPEEVTPEDSKGFVSTPESARATRFVASEQRHRMFQWLPEYDEPLSDHYTYVRSVHSGPIKSGEAFSFYQANLERRYGESSPKSYLTKWRDVTVSRMLDWGFTSLGNWADASFYQANKIPYFANGWIIGDFKTLSSGNDYWSPMPDPFDPEFVRRAKLTVATIASEVDDSPWCVGVFIDNEKGWGRKGSFDSQYGIVINALSRNAGECPTKAEFTRMMQQKYPTIDKLNTAWGTNLGSWDEFRTGVEVSARDQAVKQDYSDMLHSYASEYFRVVRESLREVMPNHLYMGVRMAHWGLTPEVIAAAKQYSDVISYNFYKDGIRDEDWAFLRDVDMPSIIGEFHMGTTTDTGMFHPGLIVAVDQADRARMFKEYMETVIDNPYFVGAHWFQYIDSPLTGRSYDGENYNVGFVTIADVPYPEMATAARELNQSLYQRRYGEVAATDVQQVPRGKTAAAK